MGNNEELLFGEGTVLRISEGQELALLGKQPVTDKEQLMYPAYRAALDALKGILRSSQEWLSLNCEDSDQFPRSQESRANLGELYTYSSNIIAFCGARGQGKTSAMLSFSNALPTMQNKTTVPQKAAQTLEGFTASDLDNTRFFVLPPIDPTMLRQNELAVELILARLLDEINEKWKAPDRSRILSAYNYPDEDNKHKILECFNTCMAGLQSEAKPDATGAEKLARAKDAFHVKEALWRIVRYFIFLLGCDLKHGYLVVQLDDTDMQFEVAYDVMEEVRKYLSIPNVIVLMATDLEQLRSLVALHNSKALKRDPSDPEVSRLATKYIDKLIPASHAIHLPSVKEQSEKNKQLYLWIRADSDDTKKHAQNPSSREESNLEWRLFNLIFKKTGLVFIAHESYLHEIVPSTLRGVVQFYRMLDRMPLPESYDSARTVFSDDEKSVQTYYEARYRGDRIKLNNLSLFEDYFLSDWIPSKLIPKYQLAIQTIQKSQENRRIDIAIRYLQESTGNSDDESRHTPVINTFNFFFSSMNGTSESICIKDNPSTLGKAISDQNTVRKNDTVENSIPYLQLLHAIDEMKKDTDADYRFVFALHTYFSILFSKTALIDEMGSIEHMKNVNTSIAAWTPLQYQHLLEMLTGTISRKEQMALLNPCVDRFGNNIMQALIALQEFSKEETLDKRRYDHLVNTLLLSFIATLWEYSRAELPPQKDVVTLWSQYTYNLEMLLYICCNWDVQHQLYNIVFLNAKEDAEQSSNLQDSDADTDKSDSQGETEKKISTLFWNLFEQSLGIGSRKTKKTITIKRAVGMPGAAKDEHGEKWTFLESLNELAEYIKLAPDRLL